MTCVPETAGAGAGDRRPRERRRMDADSVLGLPDKVREGREGQQEPAHSREDRLLKIVSKRTT